MLKCYESITDGSVSRSSFHTSSIDPTAPADAPCRKNLVVLSYTDGWRTERGPLVAAGAAFSWAISFTQIPNALLGDLAVVAASSSWKLLVTISIAYFIGCMFVDPIVVIMILTPIFSPAIEASGVDPVPVRTLVTLQVAIGSATPPFGCDIFTAFTAMAVLRRPYLEVIRGTPPFVVMLLVITALLIAFPVLALGLRDLAYG